MYEVWIDGSCKPYKIKGQKQCTTGSAYIGVVLKENGKPILEYCSYIGENYDNNQVEYEALIYALDKVIEYDISSITIYTDSNLVEKQMNDKYGAYSDLIVPYYIKAKKLMQIIPECVVKLIPRALNREADTLANKACKERMSKE